MFHKDLPSILISFCQHHSVTKSIFFLFQNWQQLYSILSDTNIIGLSGEPQEVFDAVSVLHKQISNIK